jgi:hypothetical protein
LKKRTLFIGDIQGCYDEFVVLLAKLQYDKNNDRLFLVGDVINRGPKSKEVLNYLLKNPQINVVMGNHEYHFLKWIENPDRSETSSFTRLYQQLEDELDSYINLIKSWPFFIEENNFIVVHAGLWPDKKPENTESELLCSMREIEFNTKKAPWFEFYTLEKTVIFGHWAQRGIVDLPKVKGLDSGCVYGNALSAYILEENKIINTSANKMWYDPIKKSENW